MTTGVTTPLVPSDDARARTTEERRTGERRESAARSRHSGPGVGLVAGVLDTEG
ncbi:hypothetical protein [Halogeometricum pallidum]|uniref:hypothetical protein n=1 Tax=Halogeometricum pallidum TaxID=411361 RepID=UPI001360B05D|nr:hypothetical protein [Halogeometricum pallidum]